MDELDSRYEAPTISDYGDLLELTGHKTTEGTEDGCMKTMDGGTCSQVMGALYA